MNVFKRFLKILRESIYAFFEYIDLDVYEEYLIKNKGKRLMFKIKHGDYSVNVSFKANKNDYWRPYVDFSYSSYNNSYEYNKHNFGYETHAFQFIEKNQKVDDILELTSKCINDVRKEINIKKEYKRSINIQ